MFPNGLFNNPWHSWCSPTQLEDVQMVCQNDLFDDEMSSTSDPADHTSSTAALTQSQVGISSSSAHAQAHTSNLMLHAASQHEVLEPECHINIWKLCIPSHHNSLELQHSISHAHTRKGMEPDTPMELGSSVEGRAIPLMAPKCHYEEVDVSQSLQQELYGKEEIINKL
ncbi:hypothetical protein F5141DRAFT_1067828 [Pisolithus sp. B1]|nr:hypothetical protein F5141DRAFT_1067828 [Pisolithus sp. B1]